MAHTAEPIPTTRATRVRYGVLAWLCLAAMIAYIHRGCIAVPADTIREDLGITVGQMGWVLSGFYFAYALFQIPAGWLGDLIGTRRALTAYCLVWSLCTALMGVSVSRFWSSSTSGLAWLSAAAHRGPTL